MPLDKVSDAFEIYKNAVFKVNTDLQFWQSFLKYSIDNYQNKNINSSTAFSAIFPAYDIDVVSNVGNLKTRKEIYTIKTEDLEIHKSEFFDWVMNLSILKVYNALEVLFIQAIQIKYFPLMNFPIDKKSTDHVSSEIRNFLTRINIKPETKNNKHIVKYLEVQCPDFKLFLGLPIRSNFKTNWANFFSLVSILRNIIAHQGTVITQETHNSIKSTAKDVFEMYFTLHDQDGIMNLKPKDYQFMNFIQLCNDFAVNSVKLIFAERDLTFLKLT